MDGIEITSEKFETQYRNGVEYTAKYGDHKLSLFIGTINHYAYPGARCGENYRVIEYANNFVLDDVDNNELAQYESIEEAVKAFFDCKSDHKTLVQKRTLVNGKTDGTVIAYRWGA